MRKNRKSRIMDVIRKTKLRNFLAASRTNKLIALLVILAVGVTGYWLVVTKAGGFFAATEPDSGTLTCNVQLVTDSTASGGKAIQFTAPVTPPPSGGSDCWP